MNSSFRRRIKKIGLPPGTLIPVAQPSPVKISVIDYDSTTFVEKNDVSVEDCLKYLKSPAVTWIEIRGTSGIEAIQKLGLRFGLHPLLLEDVVSQEQRPKLDDYKETIYIVVRRLIYSQATNRISDEQISIVLGKDFVITFQESLEDFFEPIKVRLRKDNTNMRKLGPDYLVYTLVDFIVDNYFVILEKIDENLVNLESELLKPPSSETLHKIQKAKRDLILVRKSIWPMREVVSTFRRIETPLIAETTKLYIQDVYDHTIQAIDAIENFRDLTASMIEIYMSNINQRLNEIIKFLTIITTIFTPLTFVSGYYGMNFTHFPLIASTWGVPFVTGLMVIMAGSMLYYFRRRHWI